MLAATLSISLEVRHQPAPGLGPWGAAPEPLRVGAKGLSHVSCSASFGRNILSPPLMWYLADGMLVDMTYTTAEKS